MSESVEADNAALQRCMTTYKVMVFRSSKTKQVLCVEADKDFVDTLFSFLLLPVGTILHLTRGMQVKRIGGMSSIYESVNPSILLVDKQELTQPRPSCLRCTCEPSGSLQFHQDLAEANILRSPLQKAGVLPENYFRCSSSSHFEPICDILTLSSDKGATCATCKASGKHYSRHSGGPYTVQLQDQFERENCPNGFVKENLKFIVNDKLEIMPSTMIASMSVLKTLVDEPEGIETAVTVTQMLQLLRSSLTSDTCLTDVLDQSKIK